VAHKEYIPVDRSRVFDASDYPHQPRKYHMWPHFRQRMKENERFLSGEVIARTIACGNLKDNGDGLAAFHWMRPSDGVQWWFLAGFHENGYRIAVTAWPVLRDREKCLQNGRWTVEELDTMAEFNAKAHRNTSLQARYPDYVEWSKTHPNGGLAVA